MPADLPPLSREACGQLLLDLGGTAVQEVEGAMVTYVAPPGDVEGFLADAARRLRALIPGGQHGLTWRWQPQEEWEVLWRRGLSPRRLTARLVIVPSWESVEAGPGEIQVTIDPGMAFGTAEHATTRGCLRLMDPRVSGRARIADVGAGSGILAITAALLGATEVMALEKDGSACQVARENAALNRVGGRVRVVQAEVSPGSPLVGRPFDGIVANLQTTLLLPLLDVFRESLRPGGWLIMSGVLSGERAELLRACRDGFLLEAEDEEDGWWTGAFTLAGPGTAQRIRG